MNKEAAVRVLAATAKGMTKQAGPYSDMALTLLNPLNIGYPNSFGSAIGLADDAPKPSEEGAMDNTPGKALIPGVGAYRLSRRLKSQLRNNEGQYPHLWSQSLGPVTSSLLTILAGAGVGGLVGGIATGEGSGFRSGASIGAGVGVGVSGLAHLAAGIAAAIKDTRTKEQQKQYANSDNGSEWTVPGMATYNQFKTWGRSHADAVEREKEQGKA